MSKIIKIRRGTEAEIMAMTLALSELAHATDTGDVWMGGLSGNINVSENLIDGKVHRTTKVNNRLSVVTGADFKYQEGKAIEFYSPDEVIAPATFIIDSGLELPVVDFEGNPVDISKDTPYILMYTLLNPLNIGTAVFQSAPRGGGGGSVTIPNVSPILGKQTQTGELVDRLTPTTILNQNYSFGGGKGYKVVQLSDGRFVWGVVSSTTLKVFKTSEDLLTTTLIKDITLNSGSDGYSIITDKSNNLWVGYSDVSEKFTLEKIDVDTGVVTLITKDSSTFDCGEVVALNNVDGSKMIVGYTAKLASGDSNRVALSYEGSITGGVLVLEPRKTLTQNTFTARDLSVDYKTDGNPILGYMDNSATSAHFVDINESQVVGVKEVFGAIGGYAYFDLCVKNNGDIVASAIYNSTLNVFVSSDFGSSWSSALTIDSGNSMFEPYIVGNSSNDLEIIYEKQTATARDIFSVKEVAGIWQTPQLVLQGNTFNSSRYGLAKNIKSFSDVITIMDLYALSDIKFRGKYGDFVTVQDLLSVVEKDYIIYCSEQTSLEISGGSTQIIPSVYTATSETQLIASGNGNLITEGVTIKQYVGCISKDSLGFTPN